MMNRIQTCAVVLLLMASYAGVAQKYVPPPPPLTVDPCVAQPNRKIPVAPDPKTNPPICPPAGTLQTAPASGPPSAADAFPFPGDAVPAVNAVKPSAVEPSAADKFPYPGSAPTAAQAPAAPAKAGSAGDQFPYPGETGKSPDAVPEGNTSRYVPDSPAPGSAGSGSASGSQDGSSSSSSSSSSSDSVPPGVDEARKADDAPDAPGLPDAAPVRSRRHLPKVSAQSTDDRVAEDLSVAKFYSERGNFEAAYLRSKDATKAMPDDAESHFALAQAAERLRRKDEAVAEYLLYLKLDPAGERIETAQKALAGLR